MVTWNLLTVKHNAERLTYGDACRIASRVLARRRGQLVLVDLEKTSQTNTAALARLILLRRELLAKGKDLRIKGLCGQAKDIYEFTRLEPLLPRY